MNFTIYTSPRRRGFPLSEMIGVMYILAIVPSLFISQVVNAAG